MTTDLSKFSKGEQMFIGGCGVLFVLSLLPLWWKVELSLPGFSGTERGNALQYSGVGKLMVLAALVGVVLGLLKNLGKVELPSVTFASIGGAVGALLLLMLILGPADGGLDLAAGVEVSRGIFLFLGVIIGGAVAYGGYLTMGENDSPPPPSAPPPAGP